jgi:hypothetical protein
LSTGRVFSCASVVVAAVTAAAAVALICRCYSCSTDFADENARE